MSQTFRDSLRRFVPPWFSDRPTKSVAFRLLFAFAAILDAAAQFLVEGLQARLPGAGTPTALPEIGKDRGILRGYKENDAAYAARLPRWRQDWQTAGNAFTLLRQLRAYLSPGAPTIRIVDTRGTWHSIEANGTESRVVGAGNWNWDGDTSKWARFWVIVDCSLGSPFGFPVWDGFDWDDGTLYDTLAETGHIASIRALVEQWKPAHVRCEHIIFAYEPNLFAPSGGTATPDGTWGPDWITVDGVRQPNRAAGAVYIPGEPDADD